MLPNVRLSYPVLWTPKRFDEDDVNSSRAWSAAFHLDKVKHAELIEELLAAEFAEVEAKMSEREKPTARKLFDKLPNRDRRMIDGDDEGQAEGCYILNSRATEGKNAQPLILNRAAKEIDEGADGAPYAGCYVNAQVELWGQWAKYKRSNCTLLGVQFAKDGDAFGGGKPADRSAFSNLADTGEDDGEIADLA
jgi:hypothetical protein